MNGLGIIGLVFVGMLGAFETAAPGILTQAMTFGATVQYNLDQKISSQTSAEIERLGLLITDEELSHSCLTRSEQGILSSGQC